MVGYLRLGEIVVKRITVIEFGVDDGGNNGKGCFGIKVRMDALKLANIIAANSQLIIQVALLWQRDRATACQ